MKISALEEYGLRCLLQLAREGAAPDAAPSLSARQIAEREGLSTEYVAQILAELRRASLVTSVRGVHGGFRLAKAADTITVGELFRAFGGRLADDVCEQYTGKRDVCTHASGCDLAPVWTELTKRIYGFLDGVTVADIASGAFHRAPQVVPLTTLRRR